MTVHKRFPFRTVLATLCGSGGLVALGLAWWSPAYGPAMVLLFVYPGLLLSLIATYLTWFVRKQRSTGDRLGVIAAWTVAALVLPGLLGSPLLLPWHVAFWLSRSSLDGAADRAKAGTVAAGFVGLFYVQQSVQERGATALVVGGSSAGRVALVRFDTPRGADTDELALGPGRYYYGPMYNLNLDRNLGSGWRLQEED